MAMTRATKYTLANLALVAVALAVYRYYRAVEAQPRNGSQFSKLILTGICLYIVIAVVAVVRAYWRQGHYDVVGQSGRASEAGAYGMLGAGRLKNITVPLTLSNAEWNALISDGTLDVSPERFNMPIHRKDIVQATAGEGAYSRSLTASIELIDGVQQRVTLRIVKG